MTKSMLARLAPLLFPLLATAACAVNEPPRGPDPANAKPEANLPVQATDQQRAEYDGIVTARRSEVIPAPFAGRIKRIEVVPGQRVRAGDKLALIDDTELQAKRSEVQANVKMGLAQSAIGGSQAQFTGKQLGKLKHLYETGAISRSRYEQSIAQFRAEGAQGGVGIAQADVAKAQLALIDKKLAKAQLVANRDGVVMLIRSKEGQAVTEGEPVLRVADPGDLAIRFGIPRSERGALHKGGAVELSIDGTERKIWATILDFADEEAPVNLTIVNADIDDSKLAPDEVRLASAAKVRIVQTTAQR